MKISKQFILNTVVLFGAPVFIIFMWQDFFLNSNMQKLILFKKNNTNTHRNYNLKGNFGLILLWTQTYFIAQSHQMTEHIHCGEYECQVSRNRSLLPQSDLVVFNARFAKGNYIFFYYLITELYYFLYHFYMNIYFLLKKIKFININI